MTPTELHLSNGTSFYATRGLRDERKGGVLFMVYEGYWLHGGASTMVVAINPNHIVSYVEDHDG